MLKFEERWNIQLTLGIWCQPLSQHPLPPARHHQHLFIRSVLTSPLKKAKNPEMRFNFQQIVLYWLGLCTQNPGLREVDLEPSPKRCSNKISILKEGRKTSEENFSSFTAWSHTWFPALREVDLEASAKRRAKSTEALVSLDWLSRSSIHNEPQTESHTHQPR